MTRLTAIASLVATLALAGSVQAQDGKSYSGVACLAESVPADSFERGPNGVIENADPNTMESVFCPIVRDDLNAFIAGQVIVYDQHPNQNVQCRLTSRFPDGTIFNFNVQSSAGAAAAAQVLNFPMLPAPAGGHYTLRCTVPPVFNNDRSGIASMLWVE